MILALPKEVSLLPQVLSSSLSICVYCEYIASLYVYSTWNVQPGILLSGGRDLPPYVVHGLVAFALHWQLAHDVL